MDVQTFADDLSVRFENGTPRRTPNKIPLLLLFVDVILFYNMKLMVRTSYWGPVIKGKATEGVGRNYPYIIAQACDESDPISCAGCCPCYGQRIVSMEERHFLEFHAEEWELYQTKRFPSPMKVIYEFILLPKSEIYADMIQHGISNKDWAYVGVSLASMIRMDLERLLRPYLSLNRNSQCLCCHCHIRVVMKHLRDKSHPFKRTNRTKVTKVQNFEP